MESALISSSHVDPSMKLFVAIAMILVVVGHISSIGFEGPFNMFPPYSFHVAAFIFVSGYFYNETHENDLVSYLGKKVKRLLLPLYLIALIYGLVSTCLHEAGFMYLPTITVKSLLLGPLLDGHDYIINMPMWFIAPLFFAEVLNAIICKIARLIFGKARCGRVFEIAIFILYLFLGCVAVEWGGDEGFSAGRKLLAARTLFFLACFGMGRFYRVVLQKHDNSSNGVYFAIVLVVQLALITICGGSIAYIPSWCIFPNGAILTFLVTITGIAFLLRLSKMFGRFIGNTKPVRLIADNTFSIMCHHYFGFFLVSVAFAVVAAWTPLFSSFDFERLFSGYYFFYPHDQQAWALVYCIVGLAFSLIVHYVWVKVKVLYNSKVAPKAV